MICQIIPMPIIMPSGNDGHIEPNHIIAIWLAMNIVIFLWFFIYAIIWFRSKKKSVSLFNYLFTDAELKFSAGYCESAGLMGFVIVNGFALLLYLAGQIYKLIS